MASKLLDLISQEEAEYVDIRFTDPRGKLQHVTVVADLVDADFVEEGFMFDGSSIAGWKSIDQSDMKLLPDARAPTWTRSSPRRRSACTATWWSPTRASPTRATRAARP
jgi:glutamine synthetase